MCSLATCPTSIFALVARSYLQPCGKLAACSLAACSLAACSLADPTPLAPPRGQLQHDRRREHDAPLRDRRGQGEARGWHQRQRQPVQGKRARVAIWRSARSPCLARVRKLMLFTLSCHPATIPLLHHTYTIGRVQDFAIRAVQTRQLDMQAAKFLEAINAK